MMSIYFALVIINPSKILADHVLPTIITISTMSHDLLFTTPYSVLIFLNYAPGFYNVNTLLLYSNLPPKMEVGSSDF